MTLDGIDVSTWQGAIDFAALPPLKFFCAQVGATNRNGERDRNELALDSTYRRNAAGARNTGIPLIHYYVPVIRPWQEQLDWFLAQVGPLPAGEGLMFDLEYTAAKALGWPVLMAMMDEAERRVGRPVLHYGELFDQADKPERPKWCAHYGSESGMRARYFGVKGLAVWQYSGSGSVPGVTGAVDLNTILDPALLGAAMANAPLLTAPPNDGHMWLPPDALPGVILYTLGRNNGAYLARQPRTLITTMIWHSMAGSGTETPQQFANGESADNATLAELSTYTDGTVLQSLPLDLIGAGSVDGGVNGITCETADIAGDANQVVWTPAQQRTNVALQAWLIRNPSRWPKLQMRYQMCKSPYPTTSDLGGIGFHTMWGDVPATGGGTNPWTLSARSCPGYARRGYVKPPFPGVDKITGGPGTFRELYELTGAALAPIPQEDEVDVVTVPGASASFLRGAVLVWITDGNQQARLVATYGPAKQVTIASLKDHGLVGALPQGDTRVWSPSDFAFVVSSGAIGPAGPRGVQGDPGPKGDKGDPGKDGAPGADGGLAPHTHTVSPPVIG